MIDNLFKKVCTIVFTFEDDSTLSYKTTLNSDILSNYGLSGLDGLVDLDNRTLIPSTLFDYPSHICDVSNQTSFDEFFNEWGKIGWE